MAALGLLLAATLATAAPSTGAPSASAPAIPPTREALLALQPLRLGDPAAFVDAMHERPAAAEPGDAETRDLLRLLRAQALALEGRHDDARASALALSTEASRVDLRRRAEALLVEIDAATRQFLAGQARLDPLLAAVDGSEDEAGRRDAHLAAAAFYSQLAQHELALRHAERVLEGAPPPPERCVAAWRRLDALVESSPDALSRGAFEAASTACREGALPHPAAHIDVLHARWATRRGDAAAAADELAARMPDIRSVRDPGLLAAAHAQLADSLQRSARHEAALRETEAVLALSASLPTGLPLLMARRTRYEVALARGDARLALVELQAVVAAERAYMAEVRQLEEEFEAGRRETLARQQALAVIEEQNARLRLEAESSARTATLLTLLLAPVGVAVLGVLAWAWQSRRDRQRHVRLLQVDPLTGLWTRAHFAAQASAALGAAERDAQPMALVLFDLDHFSQVNSRHGHLSGDRLLAAVGRGLADLEAPGLAFGRLGGEEFAILLPRAGLDEGLAFAERCRATIATTQALALDGRTVIDATASFGVVSTAAAGYRLRDLLTNADHALYRAKGAGRNRVAAAVVVPVDAQGAAA